MEILKEISESLQRGDNTAVHNLTSQAIEQKIPEMKILDEGFIAGMTVVGIRFRDNEIFLPEVLLAARAMNAGMKLLNPILQKNDAPSRGRVLLGTVKGDMHDIGKNLVATLLKGAGFEVIDLGKDVSPEKFIEKAVEENVSIIGMSALLTTTMPVMKTVVDLVRERGLDDKIKIIVGGAPLTDTAAMELGADSYCYDASNAVEVVKKIMNIGE